MSKPKPESRLAAVSIAETRPGVFSQAWYWMTVGALLTTAYGIYFIFGTTATPAFIKARLLASTLGRSHIFGGILSLFFGPLQLNESIRRKNLALHRWVGRVYVTAVLAGGIGGFKVSLTASAHPIGNAAFAFLALAWLYTVVCGTIAIWVGDLAGHKRWMARNYSLTYAAPMLRWQLPLMILCGIETRLAISLTGLTCWVPNLIFTEWYMQRRLAK